MRAAAAALVGLVAVLAVPAALADGDPASDVLVSQNVFISYSSSNAAAAAALKEQVAAVYAHGQRVKVAVIAAPTDLGSVPSLLGQPAQYAKFLGTELRYVYVGPLLVVMPGGFGIYDGGRPTVAEDPVLAGEPTPGSTPDELIEAATKAVSDLLAGNALRSRDILPPEVYVLQASGYAGRPLPLYYRLQDDSGKASVLVQLRRSTRLLKAITVPTEKATSFLDTRGVVWHVPTTLEPGSVRYCVTATDPSGNRGRSCTYIQILEP